MAVQIQLRRGTAAAWTAANPTLAAGELVIETDTDKYKIGDGSTAWTSLGYSSLPGTAISNTMVDAVGDIFIGTADNTAGRLAVGTNDYVLTADSSVSNVGLAWKATGTPTTITVADTTDTTCFVGLWESATGDIGPKSDAGITYNAGTGTLTATALTVSGGLVAPLAINPQTVTAYTFVLADAGKMVTSSNGSAQTLTVPPTLSPTDFAVGTQIVIQAIGSGTVTLAEGSGVTINSKDDNKDIDGQYAAATLIKTATNVWSLIGALA